MTSFRRQESNIGRSEYQLRMPFPGNETPEGIRQNFRELERWGNNLPLARTPRFVPYMVTYQTPPADYATVNEVILSELWQAKYGTDVVPTGTWIVYARVFLAESLPAGTVGTRSMILADGSAFNAIAGSDISYLGYFQGDNAIRVVKDIDFITPDITYEWTLPDLAEPGAYMTPSANTIGLLTLDDGDGGLFVRGSIERTSIIDPDVGPDTVSEYMLSGLVVSAYRLTDGYTMPFTVEDITPS